MLCTIIRCTVQVVMQYAIGNTLSRDAVGPSLSSVLLLQVTLKKPMLWCVPSNGGTSCALSLPWCRFRYLWCRIGYLCTWLGTAYGLRPVMVRLHKQAAKTVQYALGPRAYLCLHRFKPKWLRMLNMATKPTSNWAGFSGCLYRHQTL